MSWFALSDTGTFHAKVVAAGNEAYGAWCRAGQWCSAQLTDGKIPWLIATTIGPKRLWKRLLDVRLCDTVDDEHLQLHDYLDHNPSAEEVRRRRAEKSQAGKAGAAKRWQSDGAGNGGSNGTRHGTADASSDSTCQPVRIAIGHAPLPSPPQPLSKRDPTPLTLVAVGPTPKTDHAQLIETFVSEYARARGTPHRTTKTSGPRMGKAAADLLKAFSLAEAQEMIRRAFADKFFREKQASLWDIANAPDKWRGKATATLVQQPAKGDEYDWRADLPADAKEVLS